MAIMCVCVCVVCGAELGEVLLGRASLLRMWRADLSRKLSYPSRETLPVLQLPLLATTAGELVTGQNVRPNNKLLLSHQT